ncbi:hypothetical protein TTHERM_00194620 (macronuclear) [Tetrahymena thermophila SB210]|uniref:Uncharacterized protein n=1 Tax=Tetrahymena thermophila (strain SB210) TaxID=312017 RepID=Q23K73_TETTS|nr:hypothetical protein TTHERM_00194620 [Tetrahymena thermophila SB210]EAR96970.2 hypothetical protein TTHERM_00194620 [Tetrahymena thermophila SB210]|eukprot:XP_001017215.2 hypothetical protein TTHERM_00194620 [Tetrahymena thermophila SB210]
MIAAMKIDLIPDQLITESNDSNSHLSENSQSSQSEDDLGEDNDFSWSKYNRQNKLGIIHHKFKQTSGVDKKMNKIKEPTGSFSLFIVMNKSQVDIFQLWLK